MTPFDQFAAGTARLATALSRLETLERRYRVLTSGFERLERKARLEQELGRSGSAEIARLRRLASALARGEKEALALVAALLPLVAGDPGYG